MNRLKSTLLIGMSAGATLLVGSALAESFDIPGGNLSAALDRYTAQTGIDLAVSAQALDGVRTKGAAGSMSADEALSRILQGTGFTMRHVGNAVAIVRDPMRQSVVPTPNVQNLQIAQAVPPRPAVETVTVTSSKLGGADVQSIPIAITALSQEQLTATQTAGGPDLVKQVPNLTFTKTNFSGYSIQIRGIGTQAISVTTDPAVAVAMNDQPFLRNHFFEQEFYDLSQAEVLRGPQGTLYGRNATAGVVNLITARPSDQFEAMASGELGNYHQRRLEGMINIPVVDDRLDVRLAGEWTKRQGYSFNSIDDQRIDGRDLWSGRLTIGIKPVDELQVYLVWEHFSEDDDRLRSSKQLCKTDPGPEYVDGVPTGLDPSHGVGVFEAGGYLSQGCLATSMYSPDAFEVPNGNSLPYVEALKNNGGRLTAAINPYFSTTQSRNLRVIESTIDPAYKVKNDILELTADYTLDPALTFTSQTGFNHDFLFSTEDYNRFNTSPNIFTRINSTDTVVTATPSSIVYPNGRQSGEFCDPQLGCSSRLVAEDLSVEHSWQLNQEFRVASHFSGPLNFSGGANYLHYETAEDYYVFINALTLFATNTGNAPYLNTPWIPGVSDNSECLPGGKFFPDPTAEHKAVYQCPYIDPNPISSLNGNGHNYFRSSNPYTLNSYAGFGEVYVDLPMNLKLTAGLRWTEDRKHFTEIPSEIVVEGWGYPSTGVVNQQWDQLTGRFAVNWTPNLSFTDQTLVYGTYAHGYKAGGANPPGAALLTYNNDTGTDVNLPIHPLTFRPEFIDAFEIGSKNTLLDGALTLNGNVFYYNYENYQISEIVDRTSINLNFDAHVKGAEFEASWEPLPGLRFNTSAGYEDTTLAQGMKAVDLIDRAAGDPNWIVVRPFVTQASNCILPTYVIANLLTYHSSQVSHACGSAYVAGNDPVTDLPYVLNPTVQKDGFAMGNYPGFDPATAPNAGAGIDKDLSGNELPNAPHFTVSAGAQYTLPLSSEWAGTLRGDFYYQSSSWARVFNDDPYDHIHGYTNLNLALIFTNQAGWQVMLYDKNVFNTTAITGSFLNTDDTGLTTNIFLTDPKLIGIRVTKNW